MMIIYTSGTTGLSKGCMVSHNYICDVSRRYCATIGRLPEDNMVSLIREHFDLTPKGIIETLNLRRPIYKQTAAFGHFGRRLPEFTWEKTDRAEALAKAAGVEMAAPVGTGS